LLISFQPCWRKQRDPLERRPLPRIPLGREFLRALGSVGLHTAHAITGAPRGGQAEHPKPLTATSHSTLLLGEWGGSGILRSLAMRRCFRSRCCVSLSQSSLFLVLHDGNDGIKSDRIASSILGGALGPTTAQPAVPRYTSCSRTLNGASGDFRHTPIGCLAAAASTNMVRALRRTTPIIRRLALGHGVFHMALSFSDPPRASRSLSNTCARLRLARTGDVDATGRAHTILSSQTNEN